jgi:hypothetical protein
MNGIMSGIKDRENYAEGTYSERYKKIFDQYSKPAMDPLSKLLIQGGLRGLSETRGGGTLANMALAFEKPTEQLMSDLQQRKNAERDMALAGLGMDIEDERSREARIQAVEDIKTKQDFEREQLEKKLRGEENIAQIELDNKGKYLAKPGVIPSIITQQIDREKSYIESGNLELQKSPDFHARKTVNFERSAPPEILKKYKGIVFYDYGRSGNVEQFVPGGEAGDIIYDPKQSDFFIFDNEGNTYRYNPLTNQAGD